jgi:hypothetical protein
MMSLFHHLPYLSKQKVSATVLVVQLGFTLFLTSAVLGQELTITSPTSDSIWAGGSTKEIKWTGGTSDSVKIILMYWPSPIRWVSGTWKFTTIVESTPNDGSYTWTVLDGYTGQAVLFLDSDSDGSANASFIRENSAGGIYIQPPEVTPWFLGGMFEITWSDNINANVEIDLFLDSQGETIPPSYLGRISNSIPSDGSYSWTIPDTLSPGEYGIMIRSVSASSTSVFRGGYDIVLPVDSCRDRFEPNNEVKQRSYIFGGMQDIYIFTVKDSITATIHKPGDRDIYSINVRIPGKLDLKLKNIPDEFDMQLYADKLSTCIAGSHTEGDETITVHLDSVGYYDILISAVDSVFSCSPYTLSVEWSPDTVLEISPASRWVVSSAGTTFFRVTSNISWEVFEDADWISLSVDGNTIYVSYDANESTSLRTATIKAFGGGLMDTVTITQRTYPTCIITLIPDHQTFSPTDGIAELTVHTNTNPPYRILESADWLMANLIGDQVQVHYFANDSVTFRSALLIIEAEACSDTATLFQEGADCFLSALPENQEIGPEGGSVSFLISANTSWSVTENAEWLATMVEGDTIIFIVNSNESFQKRNANVLIEGIGCADTIFLSQNGLEPVFELSTDSVLLGAEKEAFVTFLITANVEWKIEKNKPWLDVYPWTGTGSEEVRVEATISNTTGATRSDTLLVTGNDTSYQVVVTQDLISAIDQTPETKVYVYPNPMRNRLVIQSINSDQFHIEILSLKGQMIYSHNMKGSTCLIDLSSFQKGVYFITIRTKDFVTIKKIVKL